jgi:hypothetical protein
MAVSGFPVLHLSFIMVVLFYPHDAKFTAMESRKPLAGSVKPQTCLILVYFCSLGRNRLRPVKNGKLMGFKRF